MPAVDEAKKRPHDRLPLFNRQEDTWSSFQPVFTAWGNDFVNAALCFVAGGDETSSRDRER